METKIVELELKLESTNRLAHELADNLLEVVKHLDVLKDRSGDFISAVKHTTSFDEFRDFMIGRSAANDL